MYYPEANVLVPRTADPQSKTPAFKCVLITIAKQSPEVVELSTVTRQGNAMNETAEYAP